VRPFGGKVNWFCGVDVLTLEKEKRLKKKSLLNASFGNHSRSFSYGISPFQHYTMVEHAEKWSIRNIRKSYCSSTSTSRIYLRLRFAARTVLKARLNGEGSLSSRARANVRRSAQPSITGQSSKGTVYPSSEVGLYMMVVRNCESSVWQLVRPKPSSLREISGILPFVCTSWCRSLPEHRS
jgi:hypothetical protein